MSGIAGALDITGEDMTVTVQEGLRRPGSSSRSFRPPPGA